MIEAEIEMPDGARVFYRDDERVCPDRETKTVVEYFAGLLPDDDYYPCRPASEIEQVVKMIVGAKLIRLDIRTIPLDPDELA